MTEEQPDPVEIYKDFHRFERLLRYGFFSEGPMSEHRWSDPEFHEWDDKYCRLKGWKDEAYIDSLR